MVFTEFAALVQSRWLLLRGGGASEAAKRKEQAEVESKQHAARKSRRSRSRRNRSRSRHRRGEPQEETESTRDSFVSLAAWGTNGVEAAKQLSPEYVEEVESESGHRFFDSLGGYSTLDEDEELQELLAAAENPLDVIDVVCASSKTAAAAAAMPTKMTSPMDLGAKQPKVLGSPDDLVDTEPEDDDEMDGMLRASDFSGYSTFDDEEESRDLDLPFEYADSPADSAAETITIRGSSVESPADEETYREDDQVVGGNVEPEEEPTDLMVEKVDLSEESFAQDDAVPVPSDEEEKLPSVQRLLKTDEISTVSPVEPPLCAADLLEPEPPLDYFDVDVVEKVEQEPEHGPESELEQGHDMFGQSTELVSTSEPIPIPDCPVYCPGVIDEYAAEIYANLRKREGYYHVSENYFDKQPSIRPKMRAVLVDWIVEVHQRFELEPQTLYLTVNYIDRFLSLGIVKAQRLQLVGITALMIASKFEEIYPCDMDDLLYICERSYTRADLLDCERDMLNAFSFNLAGPTCNSFLGYLLHDVQDDPVVENLANYFAELTLPDFYFSAEYEPSKISATCLLAAYCYADHQPPSLVWNFRRQELSGYSLKDLAPCARHLWRTISQTSDLVAVASKYGSEELGQVSHLPLDDLEFLLC